MVTGTGDDHAGLFRNLSDYRMSAEQATVAVEVLGSVESAMNHAAEKSESIPEQEWLWSMAGEFLCLMGEA